MPIGLKNWSQQRRRRKMETMRRCSILYNRASSNIVWWKVGDVFVLTKHHFISTIKLHISGLKLRTSALSHQNLNTTCICWSVALKKASEWNSAHTQIRARPSFHSGFTLNTNKLTPTTWRFVTYVLHMLKPAASGGQENTLRIGCPQIIILPIKPAFILLNMGILPRHTKVQHICHCLIVFIL